VEWPLPIVDTDVVSGSSSSKTVEPFFWMLTEFTLFSHRSALNATATEEDELIRAIAEESSAQGEANEALADSNTELGTRFKCFFDGNDSFSSFAAALGVLTGLAVADFILYFSSPGYPTPCSWKTILM
jgi:hypothetical protein